MLGQINEGLFDFLKKRPKEDDTIINSIIDKVEKEQPEVTRVEKGININHVDQVVIDGSKIQTKEDDSYYIVVDGIYLNGSKAATKKLVTMLFSMRSKQQQKIRKGKKEEIKKKFSSHPS